MIDQTDTKIPDQTGPIITGQNSDAPIQEENPPEKIKAETSVNIEKLHKEKAPQEPIEPEEQSSNLYDRIKWSLINLGPVATAIGHLYAAGNDLFFFKDFENSTVRKFVDNAALNLSKVVLTLSCGFNGYEAMRKNRLWEAASRFVEPIFILAEKRTEDLNLARGIGLGISQLVGAQEGIYNELVKQKYDIDLTDKNETRKPSMGQDHDVNWTASKKIIQEIFEGGLGKNRRFLTGLGFKNIAEKVSKFFKKFNIASVKELFSREGNLADRYEKFCEKSGLSHIQEMCMGDDKKDQGHTTFLSGSTMIFGSLLGYMDKESKGFLYKLGGTIRNLGGILADISIFGHKDPYFNASAIFLAVSTFMDTFQRFIPPQMRQLILPWSNFSMATYNVGCGLYLNRSDMKSNQQDVVQTYDTDLVKKQETLKAKDLHLSAAA